MRSRVTFLICLLALLAAVALPSAAGAQQGDAFSELTQNQQQQQAPSTSSNTNDGGLQTWQEVLIFLAGGILLGGIGWAIVKDARSAAPVEEPTEQLAAARAQREDDIRRRKQRARVANKRAKAARKRNR